MPAQVDQVLFQGEAFRPTQGGVEHAPQVVNTRHHRVVILDNVIDGEHSQTVAVRFDTDRHIKIVGYQPFGHGSTS